MHSYKLTKNPKKKKNQLCKKYNLDLINLSNLYNSHTDKPKIINKCKEKKKKKKKELGFEKCTD